MDSPACTWQSKEAINHEDNASPPLSELRSWDRGVSSEETNGERRERERERRFVGQAEEEYERQRREGPRKK